MQPSSTPPGPSQPPAQDNDLLLNPFAISKVNLQANGQRGVSILFESQLREKFLLLPITLDWRSLSLTECHCLIDLLTIAFPGTAISIPLFTHLVASLRNDSRKVSNPLPFDHAIISAVFAGWRPERPRQSPDLINMTHLLLDDGQVVVRAQTNNSRIYILALTPSFPNYGLSASDCRFLILALYLLCKGTILSSDNFLSELYFFREICPNFSVDFFTEDAFAIKMNFKSDPLDADSPIPSQCRAAAAKLLFNSSPWFLPFEDTGLTRSPFPFICLGETLCSDSDGEIYFAIRRHSPCAVRIFRQSVNTTTFFSQTVKQLLLIRPHPNVVGVLDFFVQPERAILLEDMRGTDLLRIVETMGAMDEKAVIEFSMQIARGLVHLHSYGFVHHELGLFHIILQDGTLRITHVEFGFISLDLSQVPRGTGSCSSCKGLREDLVGDVADSLANVSLQGDQTSDPTIKVENNGLEGSVTSHEPPSLLSKLDDRVDVACFGVVLWEMLSGATILVNDGKKMTEELLQTLVFDLQDDLMAALEGCEDATKTIIKECWTVDPRKRPKMEEVLADLKALNSKHKGSSSTSVKPKDVGDREFRLQRQREEEEQFKRNITGGYLRTKLVEDDGAQAHLRQIRDAEKSAYLEPLYLLDRNGEPFDALANYESRYPRAVELMKMSTRARRFLNYRNCISLMNALEAARNPAMWMSDAYYHCKPGINLFRRKEAFEVFGTKIMSELDKGFSPPVRCQNVDDIFDSLTTPYRKKLPSFVPIVKESHLRVALSYRHVHPDERTKSCWEHRQRIPESGYRKAAEQISRYACSVGAETVAIWTDQHFAGAQTSDSWANNCLLPYAIYPVIYYDVGEQNESRLWICAEHQLALSGEGIVADIGELPGVWRKTKPNAVAGKLLPLFRGLVESASCLLPNIETKHTYHEKDKNDIISWTKALAFFGYSRDIWVDYKDIDFDSVSTEVVGALLTQGFSPGWIWACQMRRWAEGAVLRTSNQIVRGEVTGRRGWHGLWGWIDMNEGNEDESEVHATAIVENITRVTTITGGDGMYGFVFLIGRSGQICRCAVVRLCAEAQRIHVKEAFVMSDYDFTCHAQNLQQIACMKIDMEQEEQMDLYSIVSKFASKVNVTLTSERIGRPNAGAVNDVLKAIGMPCVGENMQHFFANGYEIFWD